MNESYLIKDLARITGYSIHTLKFYLKIGLINEVFRGPGTNFRYFDETTVQKLKQIRQMRLDDKSIQEIKDYFKSGSINLLGEKT